MKTECKSEVLNFQGLGRLKVEGAFDGGHISCDGGALLLREVDSRLEITRRLSECFTDYREAEKIEHRVKDLLSQRIYGLALAYEDLNDFNDLQKDPLLALSMGRDDPVGKDRVNPEDKGKALASASTLNRLELTPEDAGRKDRYKKIVYHGESIRELLIDIFMGFFKQAPDEIVLDIDATDDPIHGTQEGRFFHGYYKSYCYLPLYVTCGNHVLNATLRSSNIDAASGSVESLSFIIERIRQRWPDVKIIVRGDSGFARNEIMSWCEKNHVYYVLGLAQNSRLLKIIRLQQWEARELFRSTGQSSRVFTEFRYRTLNTWSQPRRVVAKAEHLSKGSNPRFVVTNLPGSLYHSRELYENLYCARGEMENRIKEQQLYLFADRTSSHTMRANQLRLWFSTFAYTLINALGEIALTGSEFGRASCGTIRLKLLKIGAEVKISTRRYAIHFARAYPYRETFIRALDRIRSYPMRL